MHHRPSLRRHAITLLAPLLLVACSADSEGSSWDWGGSGGAAGSAGAAGTSGSAGTGGNEAGAAGQGGSGAAAGQAGSGGAAGQPHTNPSVAILSPLDGATVENPVDFAFEAHDVTQVELLAEGHYSIALGWDPTQSPTHSMTYAFSGLGVRTLTLNGYAGGATPATSDTIEIEVVAPPLCDGFASDPLIPPTVCDGPNGNTTTEVPANGLYATSWFGCYRQGDGTIYEDPYDNCEFACGPMGYCPSGQSGPACEADLQWFAADADRYGCGGLIRVTNCENGRAVVLVTLDRGPNCNSVEKACDAPVLDMSHPAMEHLFEGGTYGGCDHKRVVVEPVPDGTPIGPV